ncbi:RNA polymerase-associated protein LEO1-like [Topomyia yanbarensis]|uniref:RNA polymerase-associated protein LEO1-like n=1 Tax=Topomyia yanbarensis TaxID=2498891 RepID=UPI00273C6451|nr:RNA polymerase-associated protein LEO1-like [Topomyia yanbarensis]
MPEFHRSRGGDRRKFGRKQGISNDVDGRDDYEYKFANQDLTGSVALADIGDTDDAGMNGAGKSSLSSEVIGAERDDKDSRLVPVETWRPVRKILSIEENSPIYDEDGMEPDYDDNKRRTVGQIQGLKSGVDSYRSRDDDDDDAGREGGSDFYQQLKGYGDSYGDISDSGSFVADTPKAYNERRSVQEMNRRLAGRNRDKAVYRKPRWTKQSGGGEGTSPDDSIDKPMLRQGQTTVYHQHHEDSNGNGSGTNCDCALICAKRKKEKDANVDEESDSDRDVVTTEPTDADEEEKEGPDNEEAEDEEDEHNDGEEDEEERDEEISEDADEEVESDEQNKEEDNNQTIDEHSEESTSTSNGAYGKSEVYIDLKIGVRNLGNGSVSTIKPLEFHKKIVVDRENLGSKTRFHTSNQKRATAASTFPIDLVKAIYQLVDSDDSLRKHVAPRLPDRTKLLFNLEQHNRSRRKINDRRPKSGSRSAGTAAIARIEEHQNSDKGLADVIAAIEQLIRQRLGP